MVHSFCWVFRKYFPSRRTVEGIDETGEFYHLKRTDMTNMKNVFLVDCLYFSSNKSFRQMNLTEIELKDRKKSVRCYTTWNNNKWYGVLRVAINVFTKYFIFFFFYCGWERMALLIKYLLLLDWILMVDSKTWQKKCFVYNDFFVVLLSQSVYLLHIHTSRFRGDNFNESHHNPIQTNMSDINEIK